MTVNKITVGFVIQQFDLETRQFVNQEFIASDESEFETVDGEPADPFDEYLAFEMQQPQQPNTFS